MESVEIKYKIGREDYDEIVDKCYKRFLGELEYELINSEDPLKEAQERLRMWQIILFENSVEADEVRKLFSKYFDTDKIKGYVKDLSCGNEELLLKTENTDLAMLGASKGLLFLTDEIKGIINDLKITGKYQKPAYTLSKEGILGFKDLIDNYANAYYQWLTASYGTILIDSTQISQTQTEIDFIRNEIKSFNWLLAIDNMVEDNSYLMKRLELKTVSELISLQEVAIELKVGNYVSILSSFIFEKQILAGKVLAIKRYLDFLKKLDVGSEVLDLVNDKEKKQQSNYRSLSLESHSPKNIANITTVMNLLIKGSFLGKDTTIASFRSIFMGEQIKEPVNWIGTQPELRYFISYLMGKELDENQIKLNIKIEKVRLKKSEKGIWTTTGNCFLINGKRYPGRNIGRAKIEEIKPKNRMRILRTIASELD